VKHDFRDQKPARIVVDALGRASPYLFVDPIQDGVVRFHGHDVDILLVFEEFI
jgi:hypothetical protein